MAWRPTDYLFDGELDNTQPNRVTGWMRFVGMNEKVVFDLQGDFHRDIRGTKIGFKGNGRQDDPKAARYMMHISPEQTGEVGDITAGLPPQDYVSYPYLEWYSKENGRVVIELELDQVEVIGRPIPISESDPISREEQDKKMVRFLTEVAQAAGAVSRKER